MTTYSAADTPYDQLGSKIHQHQARVGIIGLGIMGRPMSRNLMKAGHQVVAYDVVPALADAIVADGAARGASCSDVAPNGRTEDNAGGNGPKVAVHHR